LIVVCLKLRVILDKVKVQNSFWTFDEDDVIMKIYHQAEKKKQLIKIWALK
jgi:hypothetical protein